MKNNLYTIAVLTAKDGRLDELLGTLTTLANATRQEHGCIEYGFYRDESNRNAVLSFERWVDADAESAHWNTQHLGDALQQLESILEEKPTVFKAMKVI